MSVGKPPTIAIRIAKFVAVTIICVSLIIVYFISPFEIISHKESTPNDMKMELQQPSDMKMELQPPSDMKMELQPPSDMKMELQPVDWTRVFNFVPNGLTNCKEFMANTKPSKSIENFFPQTYMNLTRRHGKEFSKIAKAAEGYSTNYLEEAMVYWKLVQAPMIRTVCETGFNGGHSTLLWLSANPNTHVYSFDIGQHSYSRPMAKYIQSIFPGRLNVTWGSSVDSLPLFHANHPDVLCDFVIIDGGHTRSIARSDMTNFRKFTAKHNILLFDNYPSPAWNFNDILGPVWEEAKQTGEISELFRCSYLDKKAKAHGFSVGRFNYYY